MMSKDPEVSEQALIKLIYLHLKENGHEKAANVLKKHAPQVKTTSVKASLNDIFKKWQSEESGKNSTGEDSQGKSTVSSSAPKPKRPRNVPKEGPKIKSKKKDKLQIAAGAGDEKRKRPQKKKDKTAGSEGGHTAVPEPPFISPTVEDDSDSDSSLDVEKWKRLALEFSAPKPKRPRNVGCNISSRKKDRLQTTAGAGNQKSPQKKEDKTAGSEGGQTAVPEPAFISPTVGDNSDSDSSLDVEKWKRLVLAFSDADMVKTNISTSTATFTEKSAKIRQPAKTKNDRGTNMKSRPSARKTKVKPAINPSKTMKTEKSSKQRTKKTTNIFEVDEIETPSKKAKDEGSLSEPNVVEIPVNEMNILSEQLVIPKTDDLSENGRIKTPPEKVKHKKKNSKLECNSFETTIKNVGTQKLENLTECKQVKSSSKKSKSKVITSPEPLGVEPPSVEGDAEGASSHLIFDHSEKNNAFSDPKLVETSSKKAKSKKSVEHTEPVDGKIPSEKADAGVANKQFISDHSETPSKIAKAKKSIDILSPTQVQTPSKKAKAKKAKEPPEPLAVKSPSTNADAEVACTHLTSDQVETPSKTAKAKKSDDIQSLIQIETPSKKAKAKKAKELPETLAVRTPSTNADAEVACTHLTTDQVETPSKIAKAKKSNYILSPMQVETPSKKAKTKKAKELPEHLAVKTPSTNADAEVAYRHLTSDQVETPSETAKAKRSGDIQGLLQIETPSKKTKAEKARKPPEPIAVNTQTGKVDAEDVNSHLNFDHSESLSTKTESAVEAELGEKPSKKVKAKKTDNISELNIIETPSQKNGGHVAVALSEAVYSETPSKKAKHQKTNTLSEALLSETQSKKSKKKKSTEADHAESPSMKACLDIGGTDKKHSKKSKCKMPDNIESDETHSVTDISKSAEHIKSRVDDGSLLTNQTISSEDISSPSTETQQGKKKRKNRDKENVNVSAPEDGPAEPKKRKKEKKKTRESDDSVVEDVPPASLSEVSVDTVESSQEKKKKKKKKDRDEKQALVPSPEEETPKKKKKSSKEKAHVNDVAQEGQI